MKGSFSVPVLPTVKLSLRRVASATPPFRAAQPVTLSSTVSLGAILVTARGSAKAGAVVGPPPRRVWPNRPHNATRRRLTIDSASCQSEPHEHASEDLTEVG